MTHSRSAARASAAFVALLVALPALHRVAGAQTTPYDCATTERRMSGTIVNDNDETGDGRRETIHFLHRADDDCLTADLEGVVTFSDDLASVVDLGPGSLVRIEEVADRRDRTLSYTRDASGKLQMSFTVDGHAQAMDDSDRLWSHDVITRVIRETGYAAPRRVEALRARGGVNAVLRETALISSDGARRRYYEALIGSSQKLSASEIDSTLLQASRLTSSDGDLAGIYRFAMRRGYQVTPRELTAVMRKISSDGDKRGVLTDALAQKQWAVFLPAMEALNMISSDGDKAGVLRDAAPALARGDSTFNRAWFEATRTISSDGDKASVLRQALAAAPTVPVALAVTDAAARISSDGDKSSVLMLVLDSAVGDNPDVRKDVLRVARGISSDGDYRRVMDRLLP